MPIDLPPRPWSVDSGAERPAGRRAPDAVRRTGPPHRPGVPLVLVWLGAAAVALGLVVALVRF